MEGFEKIGKSKKIRYDHDFEYSHRGKHKWRGRGEEVRRIKRREKEFVKIVLTGRK